LNEEEKKYLNIGIFLLSRNLNLSRSPKTNAKPINLQMEFRLPANASEHKTTNNNPNSVKHGRNGLKLEFQATL
jgi:hypothetical protein